MSDANPTEEGNRWHSLGGRMEAVCDRFEAAWKAGRRPAIEDHLDGVPEARRAALFRELLVLELAYRRRAGERPTPEEYRSRFPEHAELIEAVFSEPIAFHGNGTDHLPTRQTAGDDGPGSTQAPPAGDADSDSAGPRYQIRKLHARGGLGEVFEAYDRELRRKVALKQMQARHADSPESRARFVREAEITGRLEHPGIVPVYGLSRDPDGRPYYAMRFIEGETLKEAIQRFHQAEDSGRDPGERILALRKLLRHFLDVCDAVNFAHQPRGAAPGPEAGEHHARPPRRDAGRRLGPGQADRSARGSPGRPRGRDIPVYVRIRFDAHGDRRGIGYAAVHEPGAGGGPVGRGRPGQRRLQPGGDALHPPVRPFAVRPPGRRSHPAAGRAWRTPAAPDGPAGSPPPACPGGDLPQGDGPEAGGSVRLGTRPGRRPRALAGRRAGRGGSRGLAPAAGAVGPAAPVLDGGRHDDAAPGQRDLGCRDGVPRLGLAVGVPGPQPGESPIRACQ